MPETRWKRDGKNMVLLSAVDENELLMWNKTKW